MTVHTLIERLKVIAEEHGWECRVLVVDGEGDWPFSVHVEPEVNGEHRRMVVCIDTTDNDEPTTPEPETHAPDVTDIPA